MLSTKFSRRVSDPSKFNILLEFTSPAGEPPRKLISFIEDLEGCSRAWPGLDVSAVTVTHNPSGNVTASPVDVLAHIEMAGGLRGLEYIPHVSAKGLNQAELETFLRGLVSFGVENCFVITGDKPAHGMSVFEFDSLNLLQLINRMNADAVLMAGPGKEAGALLAGVAVGLTKYEEGTCLQQLIKLEKKIRFGNAGFVFTNITFDPRKSKEIFTYLDERSLKVPVLGSVFFLDEPAGRRMLDEGLPGVYISPELYEKVRLESFDDYVKRAALQVAMWRDIGAAGVDISNVENVDVLAKILDRAVELGADWREGSRDIDFPPPDGELFYLYQEDGSRTKLREPHVPARRKFLNWTHGQVFEPGAMGFKAAKAVYSRTKGLRNAEGVLFEASRVFEEVCKGTLACCEFCGDCFLPENFFVCLMGECAKGLPNVPCGDSTIDGMCGVDPSKPCAGRLVYDAARYFAPGIEAFADQVNPSRNPDLRNTSSFRNFFLELDHHKHSNLIEIAELLHSSIPKVREALEIIWENQASFEPGNPGADYLAWLVEAQAIRTPAFIDANVDDAGGGVPGKAEEFMRGVIRTICRYGHGIPPCIDSSDPEVIRVGFEEYLKAAGDSERLALINSSNKERVDFVWELREIGSFNIVYMLMGGVSAGGAMGEAVSPEEIESDALSFFREACSRGFKPEHIYFDTTVIPLATEFSCFDRPGFNYLSLAGLRRIMNNKEMSGVNSILGVTNLTKDFPPGRKIGLLRAFIQIAMEAGLTAAIVDVRREFGSKKPADEQIVEIVRAFTSQDGSNGAYDRMSKAYELYKTFGKRNPS